MYLLLFTISTLVYKILASSAECGKDQFPCDSGLKCINRSVWCDKAVDCDDGSDEAYCKKHSLWSWNTDPNECEVTHYLCDDGICVPKIAKCDGYNDCKDRSDEKFCFDTEGNTEESYESNESISETEIPISTLESEVDHYFSPDNKYKIGHEEPSTTSTLAPTEPPISTSASARVYSPSSTMGFYDLRRKEVTADARSEISAPTRQPSKAYRSEIYSVPTKSTTRYIRPPSTTPVPPSTYSTRTVNRYIHYSTFDRLSSPPPSTYDNRGSTHDRRQPTYDTHPPPPPSTYAIRGSTHDRRQSTHDRLPRPYDARPDAPDRRYSNHASSLYTPHSTHDNRLTIDARTSHTRPSGVLNGEPYWRQTENLRPYSRETKVNSQFYFAKDYATLYGRDNSAYLRDGANWLLRQRDALGSWGRETPRALIVLALVNGSFPSGVSENELMKRNFMVQLGIDLLRNDSTKFTLNRMSMAMNALLAVCENPRDFHGIDLTEVMAAKMREQFRNRPRTYINPAVYLSLCLSGKTLSSSEVQTLMKQMQSSSSAGEMVKDMQILAIQAFACYIQQSAIEDHAYRMSLQEQLHRAVSNLLLRQADDGSFGSVYSTAIAAQALISVNDSGNWQVEKTMNFLKQHQRDNGSFGDLLATYFTLPALSGRSLLHLRNIRCEPAVTARDLTPSEILEFVGPRQYVHYSIYFGYPLTNSHSVRLLLPWGITLLDAMRVAQYQDEKFRFSYQADDQNLYIYSVSGVPNDFEQGFAWYLYVKRDSDPQLKVLNTAERHNGDVRKYLPKSDEHFIFWYHSNRL